MLNKQNSHRKQRGGTWKAHSGTQPVLLAEGFPELAARFSQN